MKIDMTHCQFQQGSLFQSRIIQLYAINTRLLTYLSSVRGHVNLLMSAHRRNQFCLGGGGLGPCSSGPRTSIFRVTSLQNVGSLASVKPTLISISSLQQLGCKLKFTIHYCIHVVYGTSATGYANCWSLLRWVY